MQIVQSSVSDLVDSAFRGRLNLPVFQRDFKWTRDQVKNLIDSLLRGYPIGAFLIWDNDEYSYARADSRLRRADWLVDGQQRLTALCLIYNKRPCWWDGAHRWSKAVRSNIVFVNIRTDDTLVATKRASSDEIAWIPVHEIMCLESDSEMRDYSLEFARKTVKHDQENSLLSEVSRRPKSSSEEYLDGEEENVSDLADIETGFAYVYDPYEDNHDLARRIESRIRRIQKIGIIQVPQLVSRHPPEDMAEIFTRLNLEGVRISSTEVFLAMLASSLPKWVKEDFRPFCIDVETNLGVNIDPSVFVKALTGYTLGSADIADLIGKRKKKLSQTKIFQSWNEVGPAIVEVLRGLRGHGILSEKVLPSKNALVTLFVMAAQHKSTFNIGPALNWLMAASFGRYSTSSTYWLGIDIEIIKNSKNFLSAQRKLMKKMAFDWRFEPDEFIERPYGKKALLLSMYLTLFNRGARDWFTGDRVAFVGGTGTLIDKYKPEWHHIFPKARIRSKASQSIRDSLANLTPINKKTNRKIRESLPTDYLRGNIPGTQPVSKKDLKAHMVPIDEELWRLGSFPRFVNERAKMLSRGINRFIRILG